VSEVAFVSSPRFVEHDTGPAHPERPDRIRAVHRAVRLAGLVTSSDPFPEFAIELNIKKNAAAKALVELSPRPANDGEILAVHAAQHLDRVRKGCAAGAVLDGADTPTCPASLEIAMLSAGSALTAADFVMSRPAGRAFSAARPPGHHAEHLRPMGFCLFNNVAVAARYLQRTHGVERVAIVDFDVHHGNGTQDVFEDDPTVLFISLHQHPATLYPGSGHAHETGHDAGRGYTLNIPVNPGSDDATYEGLMDARVTPALDKFKPQVLLISAGFDAHAADPLAQMNLSDDAFEMMTRKLVAVADAHSRGRVLSVLEGGYSLPALGRSVVRHLIGLCGH
jgi:acetoin utilization deacetylase AcuC-like enzyme